MSIAFDFTIPNENILFIIKGGIFYIRNLLCKIPFSKLDKVNSTYQASVLITFFFNTLKHFRKYI